MVALLRREERVGPLPSRSWEDEWAALASFKEDAGTSFEPTSSLLRRLSTMEDSWAACQRLVRDPAHGLQLLLLQ